METLHIYGSVCMLESKNSLQNQSCSMSVFGACNSWTAWDRSDASSCLPQSFLTTELGSSHCRGPVLFLHAYAANRLSHGCSFWVIAAWCLSPCVRSFDRGSYYTFFILFWSIGFFGYVFPMQHSPCNGLISRGMVVPKHNQNQISCRVESSLETLKHIGYAMLRVL